MDKQQYTARWMDVDTPRREVSRERVAYLLRAARSRRQTIHRIIDRGYDIGELAIRNR